MIAAPTHRFVPAIVLALALPVFVGAGTCGLVLDYTETFLVTDPVDRIVIVTDDGNIDATAYDRDAMLLKRHTFGFEASLGKPHFDITDGTASYEVHCKYAHKCTFDHMFEMPFGIAFDITMDRAHIDFGYTDGDIEADFDEGTFNGVRLAAPNVAITADSAEVDADWSVPPESVTIDVGKGEVILGVPAGEYRCTLDASSGEVTIQGISCVDTATAVLDVSLGDGDILVMGITP